jgi:hypothetical protein
MNGWDLLFLCGRTCLFISLPLLDLSAFSVVRLVRLWRNLCASGGSCAPLAHRLTNDIV